MGDKWSGEDRVNMGGAKYPQLWPNTLPSEDEVRARGHMTMSVSEWFSLLTQHWRHVVVTTFTRAADKLHLLKADHPVYGAIVFIAELFHIV